MKVHLIRKETIEIYSAAHAGGKSSFRAWLNVLKQADWEAPEDIQATFGSAEHCGRGFAIRVEKLSLLDWHARGIHKTL